MGNDISIMNLKQLSLRARYTADFAELALQIVNFNYDKHISMLLYTTHQFRDINKCH